MKNGLIDRENGGVEACRTYDIQTTKVLLRTTTTTRKESKTADKVIIPNDSWELFDDHVKVKYITLAGRNANVAFNDNVAPNFTPPYFWMFTMVELHFIGLDFEKHEIREVPDEDGFIQAIRLAQEKFLTAIRMIAPNSLSRSSKGQGILVGLRFCTARRLPILRGGEKVSYPKQFISMKWRGRIKFLLVNCVATIRSSYKKLSSAAITLDPPYPKAIPQVSPHVRHNTNLLYCPSRL
ncbi:hypothetical protein BYT27DRAFT_7244414 [Phlegmacium glaucopus]|nr:hypothetical protein BYT27DRAFT_7244414 [Phlegmacium glaucopus]